MWRDIRGGLFPRDKVPYRAYGDYETMMDLTVAIVVAAARAANADSRDATHRAPSAATLPGPGAATGSAR